ncbi:MAG: response regulator transcription factor [Candidatus Gastranaerophilales bacterium]|nr:response regulator transcription factor [Candidatus Gastranaerophilales bacterium]
MSNYNVLITEDHSLIRFGLKTALQSKPYINEIFEAGDAQTAINFVKTKKIDAVIMDLGLPGVNGIEATEQIKQFAPEIKILILTSHKTKEEVINAIKAGASAYCSKEIEPENLTLILYSVLHGAIWFDPSVSDYILDIVKSGSLNAQPAHANDYNLTRRELQVLSLIKEGKNNTEIAKKLHLSVNTVKAHVSAIMQKLEVDDRTQAAIKTISNNII